jgi:hypothetical protein
MYYTYSHRDVLHIQPQRCTAHTATEMYFTYSHRDVLHIQPQRCTAHTATEMKMQFIFIMGVLFVSEPLTRLQSRNLDKFIRVWRVV